MDLRQVTITHETRAWQDAFLAFVPRVFAGIGFDRWRDAGGWDEAYRTFSFLDGDRVVANASRQRMSIVVQGETMRAWQLTAVGTLPEYRRRGLQERLLQRLLEDTPREEPIFLFGNSSVVDFYPRFGFERHREFFFRSPCRLTSRGVPLRALAFDDPADRALLSRIAARAEPVTTGFGVRDHGRIVLWYWANFFADGLRYLPEQDAIVVVAQDGDLLQICDILAPEPLDLPALLPRIATAPVSELEFGFTPDRYWPSATPHHENVQGPLFVRGRLRLPEGPFKFPKLGET